MQKAILLSILVAYVLIPALFARDPNAKRGLRRCLWGIVSFNILYLLALLFIYPRLDG